MSRTIWVGAVAYDPKVVTIWEGMRRYFHEEAHLPVEVVLFQSYEAQVLALLAAPGDPAPRIDIAWNTNLAYLQADAWSGHRCRPIAMRDTDLGWTTKIVAVTGGSGRRACRSQRPHAGARQPRQRPCRDPTGSFSGARRLASSDSDYRTLRFDSDVGKHGDTGTSEAEVVRAVLDGRADAGAIGSPFWSALRSRALGARGRAERDLDVAALQSLHVHGPARSRPVVGARFAEALCEMSYDNPSHRPVLDAEGLRRWVAPHLDGYDSLREASARQGFFTRPIAKSIEA